MTSQHQHPTTRLLARRLAVVDHDPFNDGLVADIPPPAREVPPKGNIRMAKEKIRIIVVPDRLVPRLVHELKDGLRFAREDFDIHSDTGNAGGRLDAEDRVAQLQALLNAVGPEGCTYCDDNQGRMDGRGCAGCNLIAHMDPVAMAEADLIELVDEDGETDEVALLQAADELDRTGLLTGVPNERETRMWEGDVEPTDEEFDAAESAAIGPYTIAALDGDDPALAD